MMGREASGTENRLPKVLAIGVKIGETMPVNLTITAKSGPNLSNTAAVFNNLTGLLFLPDRQILQAFTGGDTNSPPEKEFDLNGVTTVTVAVSGKSYTFTIS